MDSGASDLLAQVIADLFEAYPGREQQITQLASLLPAKFPNFLYIHDAFSIDATRSLLLSTLSSLSNLENGTPLTYVKVDCVACFSPRILYDTVLNGLLNWNPSWDDGYRVFNIEGVDTRWNDSLDSFLHGLRQAPALLNAREDGTVESSSDGNANRKIIIVFDRAEILRNNVPELLVPLTRLQELVCISCLSLYVLRLKVVLDKPKHIDSFLERCRVGACEHLLGKYRGPFSY